MEIKAEDFTGSEANNGQKGHFFNVPSLRIANPQSPLLAAY